MSKLEKLLSQVVSGRADANIAFADLRRLLLRLGFSERTRGSHHVFSREGIEERINVQESGSKAKPYQVKQVRAVIVKYGLEVNE
ncbi:MAG: type II toxin-antitoxin system HicA family toxin [Gammaproteobacteria bacterium]|nr:type II toxin-antitoxin system HicA family toxin [Gammaproteobacteria bacterium]